MGLVKTYTVEHTTFNENIRAFLKKWHYSDYVNIQTKHAFILLREGNFGMPQIIGVCIYTRPAGPSAGQTKNAESYFISKTIKWLQKNTDWEYIISYADQNQGHKGVIYRASNFNYLGETSPSKSLEVDGKSFHIRTLSMLDRPYGVEINRRYKAGDENVKIITNLPKYIYTYDLRNGRRKIN